MGKWTPRGSDQEQFSSLVDGVPPWLHRPIMEWMELCLERSAGFNSYTDFKLFEAYDMASRNHEPLTWRVAQFGTKRALAGLDENEILELVDYLVHRNSIDLPNGFQKNESLEQLLHQAGSKWTVGIREDNSGLEDRVPEGVKQAVEDTFNNAGNAGKLLAEAWHSIFGINPDPTLAYSKAIKAVETAAIPVVSPKNMQATLGTVIAQIASQGDWALPISSESTGASSEVIQSMLKTLWKGQTDRHGGPNIEIPTKQQAEAAVFVAVTLVGWFTSGHIQRI